jgi:hypothetical protein
MILRLEIIIGLGSRIRKENHLKAISYRHFNRQQQWIMTSSATKTAISIKISISCETIIFYAQMEIRKIVIQLSLKIIRL